MTSSAEEGSDFDGSNASEDEGSVSDFEESDEGRTLLIAPVTLDMILTFELEGEDWDELEKKAAKCKANLRSIRLPVSQLICLTPQRTKNEQRSVIPRRMSRMMRIVQRKRRLPNRSQSLQLTANANAEIALVTCPFIASLPMLYCAFCFVYVQCRFHLYMRKPQISVELALRAW